MSAISFFLELIKISVGAELKFKENPSVTDWQSIFELAQCQTVLGVLYEGIQRLPSEQRPPKSVLLQWFMFTENLKSINSKLNRQAVEIIQHLNDLGYESCILKGQGIATYYPNPASRTPGDIDVWIQGDADNVIKLFSSMKDIDDITYLHINYHFFPDTEVEVHYRPSFFNNPFFNRRAQVYFNQSFKEQCHNKVSLSHGKVSMPTAEFNRFYILQHIYRHLFGEGIGMRQLMDYYYVLKQGGDATSKENTLNMFRQTGMMNFVGATMWIMKEIFGLEDKFLICPPNRQNGEFLLKEVILSGNFGHYDKRICRIQNDQFVFRVFQSFKRNLRFLYIYPQEVLFDIPFRTFNFFYRMRKKRLVKSEGLS